MFSEVYFWKENLYFDLIGFDSTTNEAGFRFKMHVK